MKKILPVVLFVACFAFRSDAQLIVENNMTIEQYVQDVLLGQNVSVSNITYNGVSANQVSMTVGSFEGANTNLGMASGFLMSTGNVMDAVGPVNSFGGGGPGLTGGSDPDLVALAGSSGTQTTVNDWTIIEFDFVPLGDTMRFNYIWASEEYPEYVAEGGTFFNDFFGFFLSGPGISGPYLNNAENIALIPGTDIPVSIGTLNNGNSNAGPCDYCEFYNQAFEGSGILPDEEAYNDPYYIRYDGYTDMLTAIGLVQCGLTYHIKLAIADGGDTGYDSGVFLERDSFSSNLVVQAHLDLTASGPNGNTLYENCSEGFIVFERPVSGNSETELVAYLEYSGTAINGVDYLTLPDSVVFPPGIMEVGFPLDAFSDGVAEGTETVHIVIANIADCGEELLTANFDFFIADAPQPVQVEGYDLEICSGATATLEPIVTGGYAVYTFDWSTGETTETIDVSPPLTTTYFLTVSDTCGLPGDDATFAVTVLQTPVLNLSIDQGDEIEVECNGGGESLSATANGGLVPYTWNWVDDQGANLWGWENTLWVSSWNAGMVYVELEDACGFTATDSILITLNVPPVVVNVPETINAPCGQSFSVDAMASGGVNPYWYSWSLNGVPDWNQWTMTYTGSVTGPSVLTVNVSDQCGQNTIEEIEITTVSPAINLELTDAVEGTCQTPFLFEPVVSAGSGGFEYTWTENGNPLGSLSTLNFMSDNSTVVSLFVTDACGATAEDEVIVTIVNPEIFVTLGEDVNASCIDNTLFSPEITGGSGGVSYQWLVDGQVQAETTATYSLQTLNTAALSVIVEDFCGETANDEVTVFIPDIPLTIATWPDTVVCPLNVVTLGALAEGGEGGFVYNWTELEQSGSEITVNPASTSIYTVVAEDICGKTITSEVVVEVRAASSEFLVTKLSENLYEFNATPGASCGDVPCTYVWDFGDGNNSSLQTVQHEFDGLGSYTTTLHVTNDIGCTSYSSYSVVGPPLIYIPSSFTPNGDGLNDVFEVVASALLEYEITIFNRWGEVVFQSSDPKDVWVGDTGNNSEYYAKDGIYHYVVRVKGYDTDSYNRKGTITMIR